MQSRACTKATRSRLPCQAPPACLAGGFGHSWINCKSTSTYCRGKSRSLGVEFLLLPQVALIPRSLELRQLIPALTTACTRKWPIVKQEEEKYGYSGESWGGSSWSCQLSWPAAALSRAKGTSGTSPVAWSDERLWGNGRFACVRSEVPDCPLN